MRSNFEKDVLVFHERFMRSMLHWLAIQSIFIIALFLSSDLGIYFASIYMFLGLQSVLRNQWRVLYKISINNGNVTFYLKKWNKSETFSDKIEEIKLYENPKSGIAGHSFKIKSQKIKYTQNYNYFVNKKEIYSTINRFKSYKERFIKLERRRIRDLKSNENEE
jgi:hypothetical protein